MSVKDPVEFCVRQVLSIENAIDAQAQNIDNASWREWGYEAFCSDPVEHIRSLAVDVLKIDPRRLRWGDLTESLEASDYPENEIRYIRNVIDEVKSDNVATTGNDL